MNAFWMWRRIYISGYLNKYLWSPPKNVFPAEPHALHHSHSRRQPASQRVAQSMLLTESSSVPPQSTGSRGALAICVVTRIEERPYLNPPWPSGVVRRRRLCLAWQHHRRHHRRRALKLTSRPKQNFTDKNHNQ